MPRFDDRDRGERRGGGYRGSDPYLSTNQYNRGGRGDGGLDAGGARLYIGRLSSRTRSQDLEDLFSKYGRCARAHIFIFLNYSEVFLKCCHLHHPVVADN